MWLLRTCISVSSSSFWWAASTHDPGSALSTHFIGRRIRAEANVPVHSEDYILDWELWNCIIDLAQPRCDLVDEGVPVFLTLSKVRVVHYGLLLADCIHYGAAR